MAKRTRPAMELFRSHLRTMADAELRRLADAPGKLCSPGATGGQAVKEIAEANLQEVKLGWKRRLPPSD